MLYHGESLMPQDPNMRRKPAVLKDIKNITPGEDVRVRIIGTVLEANQDSIMLDDGTGAIEVFLDQEDLNSIKESQRVRVFGRVLPTPESFEIQGEIVQDMEDLNMETYRKVRNHTNLQQPS